MKTGKPLLSLYLILSVCLFQSNSIADEFSSFFDRYTALTSAFYRSEANQFQTKQFQHKNIDQLHGAYNNLLDKERRIDATALLIANKNLIIRNPNSSHYAFFIQELLQQGLIDYVTEIAEEGFLESDPFISSKINYLLGSYYFDLGDDSQTIKFLSAIESSEALSADERDYATVMFGITLQNMRKHREAIKIYKKITTDSTYYSYAKLNSAVAYIRQGWWTDAQISIEEALSQKAFKEKKQPFHIREMQNRLLLVLGYSQLQKEFYRNARNSFRKIGLDSQYAQRAMLGLGLCAIHQKDYQGAINVFERLKEIDSDQLPAIEAHLMVPFTHDRFGELKKASSFYTESIAYFANKIKGLEQQSVQLKNKTAENFPLELAKPYISKQQDSTLRQSQAIVNRVNRGPLAEKFSEFQIQYNAYLSSQVSNAISEKLGHLQSYMSQSQFGLAKLYDSQ